MQENLKLFGEWVYECIVSFIKYVLGFILALCIMALGASLVYVGSNTTCVRLPLEAPIVCTFTDRGGMFEKF